MSLKRRFAGSCLALLLGACASTASDIDPETAEWWRTTEALSNDSMEGRDTGSPGYDRAAAYVADRFKRAGLLPAGDQGAYLQRIKFRDIEVVAASEDKLSVTYANGKKRQILFLHEMSVTPNWGTPARLNAPLVFRGYCAPSDMTEVRGAVVACFGARRLGQTSSASRLEAATASGAAGVINIDDPGFTIEPARWPLAYARTVVVDDGAPLPSTIPVFRMSARAFEDVVCAVGQNGAEILARGSRGEGIASFDLAARFEARLSKRERRYTSDNVLAVLPGTDPALANEPVLLVAHLDGYGFGTPVNGDNLYNGALDDAAYVATLITFAEARRSRGFRRPVIFAAVTGEEKGLLGSRWLAAHPTPTAPSPVAVLNLDQLRPLYPFTILTTLALDESTLGQTVREIAAPMGIEVRPDREPDRNLLQRTDHWPFMQRGVPAVSFLFGFDYDTDAHAKYKDWYENRYHAPMDDMSTPVDFGAQAKFHRFYFALTEAVANAETKPAWLPDSRYGPKAAN